MNYRQEEDVGSVWDGTAVCTRWRVPQRQTVIYGDPAAVVQAQRRLGAVPTRQSGRLRKTGTETPLGRKPLDDHPVSV
jgi:hypothetical protein